ncbi:preprotein translocase subunit YajC [Pseudonocardia endophytica]|uniref:Preprotein translocase subunit YajC n=2 Tax=Pseudonocardia endophytica TaxID=401976 RepID=A0A4R1HJY1_PSEEN|nr:preprotein translocase subunit YajC [Pseudonocardia endophytica]
MGNSLMTFLPFLIILLLFVPLFLNGRKQRRQMQETQAMQQALGEGDVVITTSGLRGVITDASYEETIDIEIADGVVTTWLRAAVREKVNTDAADATPAVEDTKDDADETASTSSDAKVTPSEGKPIIH